CSFSVSNSLPSAGSPAESNTDVGAPEVEAGEQRIGERAERRRLGGRVCVGLEISRVGAEADQAVKTHEAAADVPAELERVVRARTSRERAGRVRKEGVEHDGSEADAAGAARYVRLPLT